MSDHTPSTLTLRIAYVDDNRDRVGVSEAQDEFDRAIAKVRTEAKQEALREAASELDDAMIIDGKGSYRAGPGNCANWLRARADKLVTE